MRLSKKLAALAVASGIALSATAAFAYWTTNGAGTGTASSASGFANAIVVNQTSTISGLVPGGTAQALSGDFANSNSGSVSVVSVTATVSGTHKIVSGASVPNPGCTAADFDVSAITVDDALVSAGALHDGAWSGTIGMKDREGTNQNACKDAIVDLSFSSN